MLSVDEIIKQILEPDDYDTFRGALNLYPEIIGIMKAEFQPHMNVLNKFFWFIKNPNFDRKLKLKVYEIIVETILKLEKKGTIIGQKEISLKFLDDLKEILKFGFIASIDLKKSQQNDDQYYADSLTETITIFYTCILHSFCDPCFELRDTVDWFIIFCTEMCNLKLNPTIEYITLSLNCLFDCIDLFAKVPDLKIKLKDFGTSDFVIELIRKISQFNNKVSQKCVLNLKQLLYKVYGFQLELY